MKIATKVTFHRFLEDVEIQICTADSLVKIGGTADTICSWRIKEWVMNQVIGAGFALAHFPEEIARPKDY